jgi:hypothetical protein
VDDGEAALLRSEVVALQAVMMAVFRRLAADVPDLAPALCRGFDEAEAILTGVAIKMGVEDPSGSAVGALSIVEEIRAGVISKEHWCSGEGG